MNLGTGACYPARPDISRYFEFDTFPQREDLYTRSRSKELFPGVAVPGIFRLNEFSTEFLSQGIAWIDPASHQVIRMRTDLLKPLPHVGLTILTTEISYARHRFSSSTKTFWLPGEVVVSFRFGGRDFRNTHRYSDYRLFSVESYEEREPVRPAPKTELHKD